MHEAEIAHICLIWGSRQMEGRGICRNKLRTALTYTRGQLIKGDVSSAGVLISPPKFTVSLGNETWAALVLSGRRKWSQQRHELSSILIIVCFIWMQRRKLHLAMRSSDDHNAINRGVWASVCLCLLCELQQLVWTALGNIWGQYTWWISLICCDFFFAAREDNHLNKQIVVSLRDTNPLKCQKQSGQKKELWSCKCLNYPQSCC